MKTKPSVCVDVDGVLFHYEGWKGIRSFGDLLPGAKEFLNEVAKFARIVIYTSRCKEYPVDTPNPDGFPEVDRSSALELQSIVEDWLRENSLPFHEVYIGQGKPFAHAYVDDRGVSCVPQKWPGAYDFALGEIKFLCGIEEPISQELEKILRNAQEAQS